MVKLNKIYTKTGDDGTTGLATGERIPKNHLRIEAYGTVDETNSAIGIVLNELDDKNKDHLKIASWIELIQNDLFDLGADLATPADDKTLSYEPLRITEGQVDRLEKQIDELNEKLEPLKTFVLPGGHKAAAHMHLARTICRRAERVVSALQAIKGEPVNEFALTYLNRLSDLLFVMSRVLNDNGKQDRLWTPGKSRKEA